jgi:G3E family GTPase
VNRVPVRVAEGPPADLPSGWVVLKTHGCPCCTARVEMQVALVRLIRERTPRGIVIELRDASHLPALQRALREWPLSQSVELAGAPPG